MFLNIKVYVQDLKSILNDALNSKIKGFWANLGVNIGINFIEDKNLLETFGIGPKIKTAISEKTEELGINANVSQIKFKKNNHVFDIDTDFDVDYQSVFDMLMNRYHSGEFDDKINEKDENLNNWLHQNEKLLERLVNVLGEYEKEDKEPEEPQKPYDDLVKIMINQYAKDILNEMLSKENSLVNGVEVQDCSAK